MNVLLLVFIMIIVIVLLMFFSARFSGLETAITNLSVDEIADMIQKKEKAAQYILKLKKDMDKTLVAILIGNNIVNILLASLAALFADMLFQTLGVTIVIVVITFLTIVFCEIVPKSRGIFDDKAMCIRNAKKLHMLKWIFNPLVLFFIFLSRNIISLFIGTKKVKIRLAGDQSIKNLASLSEQEGNIKPIERQIINHVFHFGDKKIQDVMIPIEDIFFLDQNYSIEEARKIMILHGFSRVPCINKKKEIIGVLYSKDLLNSRNKKISSLLKPPFFVLGTADISDVFTLMKRKKVHFALVLDQNKKHIGIVSLEDIIEQLVGVIYDEFYESKFKKPKKK